MPREADLLRGKRLLVHGCGAVGRVVAEETARLGATVYTVDRIASRADLAGCINLSGTAAGATWWTADVDALVPCAASRAITENMVAEMRCFAIVGEYHYECRLFHECGGPSRSVESLPDTCQRTMECMLECAQEKIEKSSKTSSI